MDGERVEDQPDRADEVELDDGAPEDAFFAEGGGGIKPLEFCMRWIRKMCMWVIMGACGIGNDSDCRDEKQTKIRLW